MVNGTSEAVGASRIARVDFGRRIVLEHRVNLVNARDLLGPAIREHFAIPFVNTRIFPTLVGDRFVGPSAVRSVVMAMQEVKAPVAFEVAQTEMKYCNVSPEAMVRHVTEEVAKAKLDYPIVIHFDHGADTKKMLANVAAGFTSIAYDGGKSGNPLTMGHLSAVGVDADKLLKDLFTAKVIKKDGAIKPTRDFAKFNEDLDRESIEYTAVQRQQVFEVLQRIERENWGILIRNAQEWVQHAHPRGISVEGEMETIGGQMATDPVKAVDFLSKTGVDILVVAFLENEHGAVKGASKLDEGLLQEVRRITPEDVALNLHGGSGYTYPDMGRAVELGISKLNYATEVMRRMLEGTPFEQQLIALAQVEKEEAAKAKGKEAEKIGNVKDARDALKTLFTQPEWVHMGADLQRKMEEAGAAEIVRVSRATGNINTIKYYQI
jgi:fructose/tagatose bisphosphate aldolase